MPSFVLRDFGCRANQADGAALARALEGAGWTRTALEDGADWAIVNTCTVTATADAEARRAIRQIRRRHPASRIAVTGCYAQRMPDEVRRIAGVTLVADHAQKARLPELLAAEGSGSPKLSTQAVFDRAQAATAPWTEGRTRPTIKVQDGCGRRCSYCVIPFVRGPHRSRPLGDVLAEIQAAVAGGVQEIVISGINLGEWGRDLDVGLRLPDLVKSILDQTRLPRLRLSSVEPLDWDERLSRLMGNADAERAGRASSGSQGKPCGVPRQSMAPRLARHAHMPLQSGCDAVLARMRRRYRAADYAARIECLRALAPQAAIGADIITGFPDESEAEFETSRAFVEAMPFTYLHVFTFSARAGTEAARQLDQGVWKPVEAGLAARRAVLMRQLGAEKHRAFLQSMLGRQVSAVTLQDGLTALSDNFLPVRLSAPASPNSMLTIELTDIDGDHALGRRVAGA